MAKFPTTRWSVLVAGRDDPGAARSALEYLCAAYRRPVLAFVRRTTPSRAEAEDLTQSFFTSLIERRIDARADPLRGRFRSLLLASLRNFLSNAESARRAEIRGGGASHASLEEGLQVDADGEDPEDAFMRHWALTVLQRGLSTLRSEAELAGKLELFDALRGFLVEAPEREDYERLAERFGMRSNTLAVAVHRLRHRLRDRVRAELAETVANEAELEDELRLLRIALGGSLRGPVQAAIAANEVVV